MTYFAMIRVLLEMDWQSSLIRNNQSISTQYAPLLAARADIYAHFSRKCGESEKCSLFFQRLASFSAADYFVQIMGCIKNSPFSTARGRASTLLTFWQKHFIPGQDSDTIL